MRKVSPLRRRWTINISRVIIALGLVCVLAVTALFAAFAYSSMENNLRRSARETEAFMAACFTADWGEYTAACAGYAEKTDDSDGVSVRWLDKDSLPAHEGRLREAAEKSISTRGINTFMEREGNFWQRRMTVVCPMVFSDGEILGVMCYSASTVSTDGKTALVAVVSTVVLLIVLAVVIATSNVFIHSILDPLELISEKAKTIAAGSYGAQISIKSSDEIGELADTINDLSAKISQNERMQTEFISSLSHELRTPLTVINGWSETLLADESLDPDTQRGLKIISGEAKRLTEMVVDLLDFTRMQGDRMTLAIELSDIRGTFEDTVYMYHSRLEQDGIRLEYQESDEDIPEIPCDPKRLRQVFLNILDNAAKHGGEGKRIDASISCEDHNVVIRIRDYGPGIPEDEIPLVKKKFYKGSSKARGTGIGLAVSDEIVQMHGGSLTLENAPGGGTLVTVRLPDTH